MSLLIQGDPTGSTRLRSKLRSCLTHSGLSSWLTSTRRICRSMPARNGRRCSNHSRSAQRQGGTARRTSYTSLPSRCGDSKAGKKAAQQLRSRDVRAIRYLLAKQVPPTKVQALGARRGEGLHAWAGRFAQLRKGEGPHDLTRTQQFSLAAQRAMGRQITWTERYPSGRVKARHRFQISAVDSDVTPVLRKLEKLAKQTTPRVQQHRQGASSSD